MATYSSPRVQITEVDISQFFTSLPTSVGFIVVRSKRGPLAPVFVSDTRVLKQYFCYNRRTIDRDLVELRAASDFLSSGYSGLWVVRAVASTAKGAGVVINTSGSQSLYTALASGLSINSSKTDYIYPAWNELPETPLFLLYCKSPGAVGNNFKFTITDVSPSDKSFVLTVTESLPDGDVVEVFRSRVSVVPDARDGYGNSMYIVDVLENNMDIGVKVNPDALGQIPAQIIVPVSFTGGVDATAGVGDLGDCVSDLTNVERWDVDLLIQGGIGGDTWRTTLVDIAEQRKDCIALLDVDEDCFTVDDILTWRNTNFSVSSSYAAVFAPWLRIYDYDNDREVHIPPSGIVAGMMARCDYEFDPWWVPAGLRRGVVRVLGLKAYYSQAERDELDKVQVNCFVRKPGVIALWGNKTLQSFESALSFIEVRRLLNYIKKNVKRTIESFLFEPLTDTVRLQLVGALDEFFRTIKQRLGVYDYRVVSDPLGTGNNPPNQVDQGILTVDVYFKPVRAIRFILLRLVVTRTGFSFEEITT